MEFKWASNQSEDYFDVDVPPHTTGYPEVSCGINSECLSRTGSGSIEKANCADARFTFVGCEIDHNGRVASVSPQLMAKG